MTDGYLTIMCDRTDKYSRPGKKGYPLCMYRTRTEATKAARRFNKTRDCFYVAVREIPIFF